MARLTETARAARTGKVESADVTIVDDTVRNIAVVPILSDADWADPTLDFRVHLYRWVGKGVPGAIPDSEFSGSEARDLRGGGWVRCMGGHFLGPIDRSTGVEPKITFEVVSTDPRIGRRFAVGQVFRAVLHSADRTLNAGIEIRDDGGVR